MNESHPSRPSRPSGGLSTTTVLVLAVVGLVMLRWVFGLAKAITGGLMWVAIAGVVITVVMARRD